MRSHATTALQHSKELVILFLFIGMKYLFFKIINKKVLNGVNHIHDNA